MKTHHVCYEGTLACSGCNPCAHCLDVVNREVLAQAMRRTTEAIAQARGPKGVVGVEELDTRNFWAVFYGFYGEGWRNLHTAMMSDPKVAERAYDLRAIPGFESTGRYVPPVIAAPLPAVMPVPAAVMPLSALAARVGGGADGQTQFIPPPGAQAAPAPDADAGTPWASSFTLRDVPGEAPGAPASPAAPAPAAETAPFFAPVVAPSSADVEAEPKLVVTPADIRRAITADDIAASATVLDAAAPAPPSANGLASRSNERPL